MYCNQSVFIDVSSGDMCDMATVIFKILFLNINVCRTVDATNGDNSNIPIYAD